MGQGLSERRLWLPHLGSGVMRLGGVTFAVRTGDWGEASRIAMVST